MNRYEIACIDSHVAGEPLRLLVGGPRLKGKTMYEKQCFMQEHFDFIRTATMLEPRGHADMFGAVLTEPCDPKRIWAYCLSTAAAMTTCAGTAPSPWAASPWTRAW